MARHEILAKRVKNDAYFADLRRPWTRPTNENANGLIRECLPKGQDLEPISQDDLNAIARKLNDCLRKSFGFETPAEALVHEIIGYKPGFAL